MDKNTQHYRELLSTFMARIQKGERDIRVLVEEARQHLQSVTELTHDETQHLVEAVERDLEEFARSYGESHEEDSVFLRVIKESLWQELADVTDKTQLEWREVFNDLSRQGVYHSGEMVGLGNLVCEQCHHYLTFYTPEILPLCPKCGHNLFQRRPFDP